LEKQRFGANKQENSEKNAISTPFFTGVSDATMILEVDRTEPRHIWTGHRPIIGAQVWVIAHPLLLDRICGTAYLSTYVMLILLSWGSTGY